MTSIKSPTLRIIFFSCCLLGSIRSDDLILTNHSFPQVTIYRFEHRFESVIWKEDWKFYCRYPKFCVGMYCDINERLTDSGRCESDQECADNLVRRTEMSYVQLNSNFSAYDSSSILNYLKVLKTKNSSLITTKITDSFIGSYLLHQKKFGDKELNKNPIPFISVKNVSGQDECVIVDYKCSPQYIINYLSSLYENHVNFFYALKIISTLFFILICLLYLGLPKIRATLNGKCILIFCILETISHVNTLAMWDVTIHSLYQYISEFYLRLAICIWKNLICLDVILVLRFDFSR